MAGASGHRTTIGVYTDDAGNTWLSGYTYGTSDWNDLPSGDLLVTKLDPAGKRAWTISTPGRLLAVTADGRALLAGSGTIDWGTGSKEADVLFAELDGEGAIARKVRYVGAPGSIDVTAITVTSADRVYVNGQFSAGVDFGGIRTPADAPGSFLAVFDATRKPLRVTTWRGPAGLRVVADDSGMAYVAGGAVGVVDFGGGPITAGRLGGRAGPTYYSTFLASYDADGKHRWSTLLETGAEGGGLANVGALALHPDGGVVVANHHEMDRFDAAGIVRWRIAEPSSNQRDDAVIAPDGTLYSIAAVWSPGLYAWEASLQRYNALGEFISSRALGVIGGSNPGRRLALDAAGRIHFGAVFFGDLSIGAPPPHAAESFGDLFVAKLKP